MYPRPIEIFIKWTIFLTIITVIGNFVFGGLMFLTKGRLQELFGAGYAFCLISCVILGMFNFLNGAFIG